LFIYSNFFKFELQRRRFSQIMRITQLTDEDRLLGAAAHLHLARLGSHHCR
jgi:hypothetical protein